VALESRQDEIDGKVSQLLASTALHTEALAELKSMLARYIGKDEHPADTDPLLSKSIPEKRVAFPIAILPPKGRKEAAVDGSHDLDTNVGSIFEFTEPLEVVNAEAPQPPAIVGESTPALSASLVATAFQMQSRATSPSTDLTGKTSAPADCIPSPAQVQDIAIRSHSSGQRSAGTVRNSGPAKGSQSKAASMEIRRGASKKRTKTALGSKEDVCPYAIGGAVEGDPQVATVTDEAPNGASTQSPKNQSPKRQKKIAASPSKINPAPGVAEGGSNEFIGNRISESVIAGTRGVQAQLLILNIHRTLLECSLMAERPSNASIRTSMITESRWVVFRPWLLQFLSGCFINFTVAFWGSKSECYMDELAAAVLARLKDAHSCKPLFVWSGKHCVATDFEDGEPLCWGKPLSKVFEVWPTYNLSNTVVVDHKSF
jgi:hypothetical protein